MDGEGAMVEGGKGGKGGNGGKGGRGGKGGKGGKDGKALEKDRNRRYDTANGLALDIQRYIESEPVLARPPSRRYRFKKLVLRNKIVFAASGAVALALFIGLGMSTWLFF